MQAYSIWNFHWCPHFAALPQKIRIWWDLDIWHPSDSVSVTKVFLSSKSFCVCWNLIYYAKRNLIQTLIYNTASRIDESENLLTVMGMNTVPNMNGIARPPNIYSLYSFHLLYGFIWRFTASFSRPLSIGFLSGSVCHTTTSSISGVLTGK